MTKFKHFGYEDGRTTNVAYLNGYYFGDRLLEGVYFKVAITDGLLAVEFAQPDCNYIKDLNKKKILKQARTFAEEYDIFSEKPDGSGEDLELVAEDDQDKTTVKPIAISPVSLPGILTKKSPGL